MSPEGRISTPTRMKAPYRSLRWPRKYKCSSACLSIGNKFLTRFSHPSTNQTRPCLASEVRQEHLRSNTRAWTLHRWCKHAPPGQRDGRRAMRSGPRTRRGELVSARHLHAPRSLTPRPAAEGRRGRGTWPCVEDEVSPARRKPRGPDGWQASRSFTRTDRERRGEGSWQGAGSRWVRTS